MNCSNNQSRDVVRVVFRYDDCSARSSLELERRFIQLFADCGAQVTLGVIPFVAGGDCEQPTPQPRLALPAEKIAMLREAAASGHVEIAQHGYSHQVWSSIKNGEFSGVPSYEQRQRMQQGKTELEERLGVSVTTFIPPWNAYDGKTLEVMESAGFGCLSASLSGPFCGSSKIRFLPASCWLNGLEEAVRASLKLRRLRPIIVVLVHDFDFLESGRKEGWLTTSDLSSRIRKLALEPNVRLCSLRQACSEGAALSLERLIPYHLWWRAAQRLPWRFRHLLENQVLWTSDIGTRSSVLLWCYQAYVSCHVVLPDFASAIVRRLRRTITSDLRPS